MSIVEIIIIGIGLAMDASTVAMADGMIECKVNFKKSFQIALTFGVMQGLMLLIGFFSASIFSDFLDRLSHWIAFGILLFLGIRMIYESFKNEECEVKLTNTKIFVQGIATSIDALLVGVSFAVLNVEIFSASLIIVVITFILSFIAFFLGRKFGDLLKNKAEVFGGFILIAIAFRILYEVLVMM